MQNLDGTIKLYFKDTGRRLKWFYRRQTGREECCLPLVECSWSGNPALVYDRVFGRTSTNAKKHEQKSGNLCTPIKTNRALWLWWKKGNLDLKLVLWKAKSVKFYLWWFMDNLLIIWSNKKMRCSSKTLVSQGVDTGC